MKRLYVILLPLILICRTVCAGDQQPVPSRGEIMSHPDWMSGCCRPYPDADHSPTRPPKGYRPFYISHLGRHGARYQVDAGNPLYTGLKATFLRADSLGILTEEGKKVKEMVLTVCEEAIGHEGELTHLGEKEQRGIAERMHRHYPGVFKSKGRIDVQSSARVRSILSGVWFTERLKELNPRLQVSRNSHPGNWDEIFVLDHIRDIGTKRLGDLRSTEFRASRYNPDGLLPRFFTDSSFITGDAAWKFCHHIYLLASDSAATDHPEFDFYKYFTPEEAFRIWEYENAVFFYRHLHSSRFGELSARDAVKVSERIVREADEAIAGRGVAANFRFGHDNNVAVLLHLLGLGVTGEEEAGYESIWKIARTFEICPFSCNVQFIFFRKGDDILAKILLNEKETLIAGIPTDSAPFYRWNELKNHINKRIEEVLK